MSNVNNETIKILSEIIEKDISNKQAGKKYSDTKDDLKQRIVQLLEDMQERVNKSIFDAEATLKSYKQSKITNAELSKLVVDALIDSLTHELAPIANFGTGMNATDEVAFKGLVQSIISDVAEKVIMEKGVSFDANDVVDTFGETLVGHSDPDTKVLFKGVTANEVMYGSRIKRGNGYDHILDWDMKQLLNNMRVTGRLQALGLVGF